MQRFRALVIASALLGALPVHASITAFKHVVIIVQENRTPDNLFWTLCEQATCGTLPSQYDIQTSQWQNYQQKVNPAAVDLAVTWDIEHRHDPDWINMCDQSGTSCLMDGAASEHCLGECESLPWPPEFTYVQRYNAHGQDVLGPYITLALNYGWANLMFATNQGPSFPAHQFIYGGTSAPGTTDDGSGIYAAENVNQLMTSGCLSAPGTAIQLIINGVENEQYEQYPCFQHETLGALFLAHGVTWRYYTTLGLPEDYWTAPIAIQSECGTSNQNGNGNQYCPGAEFEGPNPNVITTPKQILGDIQGCQLQNVSWVIPDGKYSDHAGLDTDLGPQWVASIVNAIGTSSCSDNGSTYWKNTAIVITWDDWGGWYDHEAPQLNTTLGYQLGFRVPLLFVSAYGPNNAGGSNCTPTIDGTDLLDFGSIANFLENNFLGAEGILGFADTRALQRGQSLNMTENLSNFYKLNQNACQFQSIQTFENAQYFINDNSQPEPPDDD